MIYQPGDCIVIPAFNKGYNVVYVTGGDDHSYHLAFLNYQGPTPPTAEYFDTCLFHVSTFGSEEQTHAAFDVVTIAQTLLHDAGEAAFASRLDLSGMIGLIGLTQMEEFSDIAAYFDQHYAKPDAQLGQDPFMPFKRVLMSIDEIRKRATPVNPFPTVKLYQQNQGALHFWQIYGVPDPAVLVVSWGKLGQHDGFEEITGGGLNALKEKYKDLIEEKKLQGFSEWSTYKNMILQFETAGEWGDTDDLTFRNQIWESLNERLFWTGNGAVSGGDIGSGTINLFFRAISADSAVNTISNMLLEKKIGSRYLVAIEHDAESPTNDIKIIYPPDYSGIFNY